MTITLHNDFKWALNKLASGNKVHCKGWMKGYYLQLNDKKQIEIVAPNNCCITDLARVLYESYDNNDWQLYLPIVRLSELKPGERFHMLDVGFEREDIYTKLYPPEDSLLFANFLKYYYTQHNTIYGSNTDHEVKRA